MSTKIAVGVAFAALASTSCWSSFPSCPLHFPSLYPAPPPSSKITIQSLTRRMDDPRPRPKLYTTPTFFPHGTTETTRVRCCSCQSFVYFKQPAAGELRIKCSREKDPALSFLPSTSCCVSSLSGSQPPPLLPCNSFPTTGYPKALKTVTTKLPLIRGRPSGASG